MTQVKLKANTTDDTYGTISLEQNEKNQTIKGLFNRLRYRLTYKKIKDDKDTTFPFLSLVNKSFLYLFFFVIRFLNFSFDMLMAKI